MSMRFASISLFVIACALLYYGTAEMFLVPRHLRESYFTAERALYGFLPTLLSLALLASVGSLWARSNGSANFRRPILVAVRLAIGAVLALWVGLIIIADLRQG